MAEVTHSKLTALLKDAKTVRAASVFLIYGEEFLCKKAVRAVLDLLLPDKRREHSLMAMEGGELIGNAISELNTFSFFEEGKVVLVNDAKIFNADLNRDQLKDKIEAALAEDNLKKASQDFMALLSQAGHALDDLKEGITDSKSASLLSMFDDQSAISRLIDYCREKKITLADRQDQGDFLLRSIEKGFPAGHYLIMTLDAVDRRRKLFKVISDNGIVVDCSVPKGERKADKEAQSLVLKETLKTILSARRKSIEPVAYQRLCEMTGFDLHTFSHNLEKLIDYVGDRPMIGESDVAAVVERSRQDPIFAFTNAILERNVQSALFFLDSLFGQQMHPLQALAAMINQMRKLMMAKEFALSPKGKAWGKGCPYNRFTANVLPALLEFDKELISLCSSWAGVAEEAATKVSGKKKKKRSTSVESDLRIAKNANNPYPIYQLMLRTDAFSRSEILAAMEKLGQADYQLKRSAASPRLVLEDAVFFICNPS